MNESNIYSPDAWVMAEESVAACILVAPDETLPLIRQIVSASDFASDPARSVFRAACSLMDARSPIDPTTIIDQAKKEELPLSSEWVKETMGAYLTTANVEYNATIIRESAVSRKAKDIGWALEQGEIEPQTAVEQLQDALSSRPTILSTPSEDAKEFYEYLQELEAGKVRPFLSTGLPNLDEILGGGLVSEGLITIAGRPGQGKTVAGLVIAENVAAAGGRVLYESLEMSKTQLWARRVARASGVPYKKLMGGTFRMDSDQDWRSIADATSKLSKRSLFINSTNAKLSDIERHVRQAGKLDLIVIDHLGLIIPDKVTDSLYLPTTMACHALKRLAKSTGTPVVMLCQLNRANTQRQDKRGTLADLRNSGAIEEDSDAVIFIHRDAYYLPPEEQPKPWEPQTMEMNVAKNRHGETGAVYMDFVGMLANINPQTTNNGKFRNSYEDTPWEGR
jgi:replicative DNA helicase